MQIVIENIKMPISHTKDEVLSAAREIVRLNCISATNFSIYKQSLDARRKSNIHYVYSVLAECSAKPKSLPKNIKLLSDDGRLEIPKVLLASRPVVVGMGPCGIFSALVLAQSGNPPIIIERGEGVDERTKSVKSFWESGELNPNSNVQFGEGGAGTFSDGKLNTRIGDPRQRYVLETFARFGAPDDILYKAKPHIGTDVLCRVIKNIREHLLSLGAEIRFNTCLTDIRTKDNRVCEIELSGSEALPCRTLVLAIGHSSRDTYEMISRRSIDIVPKPFAMGVRIEHSQKFIDALQYGGAEGLPPADYRIVYNGNERSCYSFCMCPGGTVVNASSEAGLLAVNGMSNHDRSGLCANSALVVTVNPSDFEGGVLGGIELQRKYERLAFRLGGNDAHAPVQLARDFLADKESTSLGSVLPTITSGCKLANLRKCLPEFVTQTLCDGLESFEMRMQGFSSGDAVLTGVETRTSAPVRLRRGEDYQSINARGLYPSGEGAGFAGGIVSSAVDGIRTAMAILSDV